VVSRTECNAVNASLLLNLINNFLIFLTENLPLLIPYLPPKFENLRPHYSHSSCENATPSSGTSPLGSCKGVPPPPGGYTVIEKRGCEFKNDKKTNPELRAFLAEFEIVPPLEPRDMFFGGRTGATTLYAKVEEGEDISYVDFTSLYPWVNKYGTYPVGFPYTIYNPEDQDTSHYFGIAQVDILAPKRLFHPVLPVREGGKLTFPLC